MKVYIYARVSTDQQAVKGYSIQNQLDACREKAKELGATEIVEFVDDFSGYEYDRPAFSDMRAAISEKGARSIDAIIAYDPDRLFRKQAHQSLFMDDMKKLSIKVYFCAVEYEDNAEGRLMLGVRGAVSEYEREKIRERTLRGKRSKALNGKIVSDRGAYGYDFENGEYVTNEQTDLVKKLFMMVCSGQSIVSITRQLNLEGIPAPNGIVWHPGTISRILHNEMYKGEAIQFRVKREKIDGKWVTKIRPKNEWIVSRCPAIVTPAQFDEVQEILRNSKKFSPRNTKQVYLLQHIAKCGICGRSMRIEQRGRNKQYYVCSSTRLRTQTGEKPCGNRGIAAELLDDFVWQRLEMLVKKEDRVRKLIDQKKLSTKASKMMEDLREKEAEVLKEADDVIHLLRRKKITLEQADKHMDEINGHLENIRNRIFDVKKMINIKNVDDRVANFMDAIKNEENRRQACLKALDSVYVVRTDQNYGRYSDTEVDVKIVPK